MSETIDQNQSSKTEECVICMSPIDSLKGSLNCVNILHKNFTNILYLNAFSL